MRYPSVGAFASVLLEVTVSISLEAPATPGDQDLSGRPLVNSRADHYEHITH